MEYSIKTVSERTMDVDQVQMFNGLNGLNLELAIISNLSGTAFFRQIVSQKYGKTQL